MSLKQSDQEAVSGDLSPTDDFYARSVVSTAIVVALFTWTGVWTAWRLRSVRASALAGVAMGAIAVVIIKLASLGQLATRHDPHTMKMIAAGGGLDEVLLLPLVVIVTDNHVTIAGGVVGKMLAWPLARVRRQAS
jgi:hypothetical protein